MPCPIVLAVAALLLGGCTLAGELTTTTCPSSRRLEPAVADYVDFVQVDGITYHAGMRRPAGRELREADLGAEHSVVRCKLADHIPEGPGHLDGDAAYLDQGTTLYEVRGYRPRFRLAAWREGRLVLYEADDNPAARTWGDLLDLGGKVRRIAVADDHLRPRATVEDRRQVARLVDLPLQSPLGTRRACPDRRNLVLAFHLDDGTATALAYDPQSRRLDCRYPLPGPFDAAVRARLAAG